MDTPVERSPTIEFFFDIVKEMKQFYETPVIFFTRKNYSDNIFDTMCSIRADLEEDVKANRNSIIDRIVDYHLHWLRAVREIDDFKKRVEENNVPREEIYRAIIFTGEALESRLKFFNRYVEKYKKGLSNKDQFDLSSDLELVEEMHRDVMSILMQKMACYKSFEANETFKQKILAGIEELLTWLDKIYDGLSMDLTKYISLNVEQLTGDMTKTLQQIVDELQNSNSESAQKLLNDLKEKGKELSTMIRNTAPRNLEISKIVEKINILEDRISRLEEEKATAAVMALQHKKTFLEKRLASLENLKTTIRQINAQTSKTHLLEKVEEEICECEDFFRFRIFNHALPAEDRERLVTELSYLWDLAVFGDKSRKSIISILSAADVKEEFTDDLGVFYLDEYSRKIYKLPGDETLYQPNEENQLVPLTDDDEHVYFYDECGRHYVDPITRERVYKAIKSNSEYVMDPSGVLFKIKEERNGTVFYYDTFGRYYINEEGKHIYRESDAVSEYENDGLGNLVRIRSHGDLLDTCPDDARVSDDYKYLKCVVGVPLRRCIADLILRQPADPIKFLSASLIKYRQNMEFKDKLGKEREELGEERERIRAEKQAAAERAALEAALLAQGGSEASYDSNLLNYSPLLGSEVGGVPTPTSARTNVN